MNKCYLDSNFLCFFKDETSKNHSQTINALIKITNNGLTPCISSLVLDEFLHAMKLKFIKQGTKNYFSSLRTLLREVLQLPKLELIHTSKELSDHEIVVDLMEKYSLKPRDAYHLLTIKNNNVDYLATFDSDFDKVFDLTNLKNAL